MFIYKFIRECIRLTAYIFFRRISVVGNEHIPKQGAVIFFGNHPNSLLDPALMTAFASRKVHFAAKDVLFTQPMIAWILKQMGAVPIRRSQDHQPGSGEKKLNNDQAFAALEEVLMRHNAMGIFPEGISHHSTQLAKLKTGAARIALSTIPKMQDPIYLVPCGLHYVHRKRFRSSVLIQFNAPIVVTANHHHDPYSLTKLMDTHLRTLTVNAETWEDVALLDAVRRLYQPAHITLVQRIELARRFNQYYPQLKNEPAIQELTTSVKHYREDLYALGLKDQEIQGNLSSMYLFTKLIKYLILMFIWIPLAALGLGLHFPFAILLARSSHWITPRKDVLATSKFLLGFFSLSSVYISSAFVAYYLLNWGIYSFLMPFLCALSGYASLKVAERGRSLWRMLWIISKCIRSKQTIKDLRQQRRELKESVLKVVDQYLPKDLERMFYQE
jgi:glycerol-3-phosphate O-acyltransferase / dihydroxyacetone phosphate acyltransferase